MMESQDVKIYQNQSSVSSCLIEVDNLPLQAHILLLIGVFSLVHNCSQRVKAGSVKMVCAIGEGWVWSTRPTFWVLSFKLAASNL